MSSISGHFERIHVAEGLGSRSHPMSVIVAIRVLDGKRIRCIPGMRLGNPLPAKRRTVAGELVRNRAHSRAQGIKRGNAGPPHRSFGPFCVEFRDFLTKALAPSLGGAKAFWRLPDRPENSS